MGEAQEVKTYSERTIPVIETDFSVKRDLVDQFKRYRETLNAQTYEEDTLVEFDVNLKLCLIHGIKIDDVSLTPENLEDTLSLSLLKAQNRKNLLLNRLSDFNDQNDSSLPFEKVSEIISSISTLDFEDAIVEISPSESLVFKLQFYSETILIINISRSELESADPLAIFALLENKETIVRNSNTLGNVIEGMQLYLVD